jgi:hypothetical protein
MVDLGENGIPPRRKEGLDFKTFKVLNCNGRKTRVESIEQTKYFGGKNLQS